MSFNFEILKDDNLKKPLNKKSKIEKKLEDNLPDYFVVVDPRKYTFSISIDLGKEVLLDCSYVEIDIIQTTKKVTQRRKNENDKKGNAHFSWSMKEIDVDCIYVALVGKKSDDGKKSNIYKIKERKNGRRPKVDIDNNVDNRDIHRTIDIGKEGLEKIHKVLTSTKRKVEQRKFIVPKEQIQSKTKTLVFDVLDKSNRVFLPEDREFSKIKKQ